MALRYGGDGDDEGARSFICPSDASFADKTMDRKSSKGYIMLLFGGPRLQLERKMKALRDRTIETRADKSEERVFLVPHWAEAKGVCQAGRHG
jgi:hypothetical protein